MTTFKNVLYDVKDGLATVTVNRPDKLNALNAETVDELRLVFETIRDASDVRAAVLTGTGEKAFIAGADIGELAKQTPIVGVETSRKGQAVLSLIESMGKPVIAAINGYALGGGCEIALAFTLRVASETAKIGLPEVSLGIIPGYGGTQRLGRLVGLGRALEMILTGDMIDAKEAHRIGLVNRVFPADSLRGGADELARKIMTRAPIAVALAKQSAISGWDLPIADGLALEAALFGLCPTTEDMKEGMGAFLEKRKPTFRGK
ncbi:MAG: enoyl-CoA hydratase/isomerase family protein [Planctomycetes bacterium]|nr:enoyl-CoA hydratase/isomerase family protein [Planctomycetota bacterium]